MGSPVQYWTENCSTYALNGQYLCGTGSKKTMRDVVVKGFAKRRAAGEVFFNPMSRAELILTDGGGFAENKANIFMCSPTRQLRHKWVGNWITNFVPYSISGGLIIPNQVYLLSQSLIDDMVREVSTAVLNQRGRADSNLFETLAEADQTFDLFNRPLGRLRDFLREAAQAKSAGRFAGRAISGASNLWLAYRYGIRPIVSDIHGIIEGLKETTEKRRVTTRSKVGTELTQRTRLNFPQASGNVTYSVDQDAGDAVTVRGMSLDDVVHSLMENIGFTTKGLITLPWELVHASFVADWFLNVGDLIGSYVPSPGWNQLGSCVTIQRGTLTKWTSAGSTSGSSYTVVSSATGSYTRQDLSKSRVSLSAPSLVVKSDFKFDKATRVSDALALASQQILRIFR